MIHGRVWPTFHGFHAISFLELLLDRYIRIHIGAFIKSFFFLNHSEQAMLPRENLYFANFARSMHVYYNKTLAILHLIIVNMPSWHILANPLHHICKLSHIITVGTTNLKYKQEHGKPSCYKIFPCICFQGPTDLSKNDRSTIPKSILFWPTHFGWVRTAIWSISLCINFVKKLTLLI